tara:strand:- start:3732 stop:4622 length:891 start_codon:yes stop_codon:yes gene_type:complete
MSEQQKQTKNFFKKHSSEWNKKAINEIYSKINDRHKAVHRCLENYPKNSSHLDIGCGTGQLVIEASKNGFNSHGIDFAEEMIEISKKNSKISNSNSIFEVASVFNHKPNIKYDVISAMGFVEYISIKECHQLLAYAFNNLNNMGSICIGSRNRLFNLTTFNSYTKIEIELDVIKSLHEEAEIIINARNKEQLIKDLRDFSKNNELIQNEKHPHTTINVETRYQFTPSDLLHKIENAGFHVKNIYPINYHAFNSVLNFDENIKIFKKQICDFISNEYFDYYQLLPNSSSFVIEAIKD